MKFTLSTLAAAVLAFPAVIDAQRPCTFEFQGVPDSNGRRPTKSYVAPGQVNSASDIKVCDSTSPAKDKTFKVTHSSPFGPTGGQPFESWAGEAEDGSSLSFVVDERGHSTASYVDAPNNLITDIYTDADGNLQSVTLSGNDYPDEADPEDLGNTAPDLTVDEDDLNRRLRGASADTQQSHRHLSDDGSQLDVLVLWTADAECRNSNLAAGCTRTATTKSNIEARINLAITETNTGYTASGVDTQLNLVHSEFTSYVESAGFSTALSDLRSDSGVANLRAQKGADIVALLIDDPQYCGIAYLGPSIGNMFSVTAWNCATGYYSFGHEIGHNLGCNHDKGTSNACSSSNYNYGWRDPSASFRSVLAYNCVSGQCDGNAGGSCTRVNRYSNPNFLYNNKAIGSAVHDNARRINDVKATVAAYYSSAPACTSDGECNDGSVCTDATCVNNECIYTPNDSLCSDGDSCTTDTCSASSGCVFTPMVCTGGTDCSSETCVAGVCVPENFVDGTSCDLDASTCTTDTCQGGVCSPGPDTSITCADGTTKCCGGDTCVADTQQVCDGKGRNRVCSQVPTGTYSCATDGGGGGGGGGGGCTVCGDCLDKNACQALPGCNWSNKNKVCT